MNISLKRTTQKNNPNVKRPRINAFGQSGDDDKSSSESDSDEANFTKSIQAKSQKIAKQLSRETDSEMEQIVANVEEGPNEASDTGPKKEGLKYMERLLHAKKQREKDRMISKQEDTDRRTADENAMVFESDLYKKQKNEILNLKKQDEAEEEEPNNAQFYSRILQMKDQGSIDDPPARETIEPVELPIQSYEEQKPVYSRKGKVTNTVKREMFKDDSAIDEHKKLIERLKEVVKSKLTSNDIREYKKRYWNRKDI